MAENNIKILHDSLEKAKKYNQEKNYGRSFAHYLVVFQLLAPESRHLYEKEFTEVLQLWGSILHKRMKYEDLFKCYHLATLYFPSSTEILNNVGIHALKLRNFNIAKSYFERSLMFDADYLPAEQNLQTTKYTLVERWHFPMLNDIKRNKSYAQAIFIEISNGFVNILDIGTGTGILSLFASKSKQCKDIVACDYSETMFDIATRVFNANSTCNKIKLLKKSSLELIIPNDMGKRATLLITEILDSGVFGENILETLIHAWHNLLQPYPYSKVIPAAVEIYLTAIQCDNLVRKVHLATKISLINMHDIFLYHLPTPYDTENLKYEKLTYLTETELALSVNFNNVLQLKSLLYATGDNSSEIRLNVIKSGRLDAVALWFKLYLNETVCLTNDPRLDEDSCWEHAVFYSPRSMPVENGSSVPLRLSCTEGYIDIKFADVRTNLELNNNNSFMVPKSVLAFLNDFILTRQLEDASYAIQKHFGDCCEGLSVLDAAPFPLLGLILVKNGAKLVHRLVDPALETVVRKVCEINMLNQEHVTFVTEESFNEFTSNDSVQFDVIYQNVLSPSGILNEIEIYQAEVLRYAISDRGLFLPENICVYAQLVRCDWLDQATKVDDKNICGFKIAEFINEYKSLEQRDVNLDLIPHTILTRPVNLGSVNTNNITELNVSKTSCSVINSGRANAIFYWFDIELIAGYQLSTRRPESFMNNATFMLHNNPLTVQTGDQVCFALKQHKGIMKIYLA